jgi:hypothetical protein
VRLLVIQLAGTKISNLASSHFARLLTHREAMSTEALYRGLVERTGAHLLCWYKSTCLRVQKYKY